MPEYPDIKPTKKNALPQQTPEQMLMIFEAITVRQRARAKIGRENG